MDEKTIESDDGISWMPYKTTAGLGVYFLFRIKRLDIVEKAVEEREKLYDFSTDIYHVIHKILKYEHHLVDEGEIAAFERILKKLFGFGKQSKRREIFSLDSFVKKESETPIKKHKIITDLITDLKRHKLEKELSQNFNYQINQDKEKIQEFIKFFCFDSNTSEALNKVYEAYYDSSEESFDFRNNISLVKEIFDSITESCLKELEEITKKTPKKKSEKEHPTETKHRFIAESLSFSEGEIKHMSALNKMLNEEKHSLISKREKYRLTTNVTVEFLMLLLLKFEKFKSNIKST